jgi:hypothetical protein
VHQQGDEGLDDDGGSKDLWNVGKLLPDYTKQQPRRQPSSYSPPWEPQFKNVKCLKINIGHCGKVHLTVSVSKIYHTYSVKIIVYTDKQLVVFLVASVMTIQTGFMLTKRGIQDYAICEKLTIQIYYSTEQINWPPAYLYNGLVVCACWATERLKADCWQALRNWD